MDDTGHVVWSHSGAFLLGAATMVTMVPGGDIGITALTNGEPHGIAEAIAAQFVDILETGGIQDDWEGLFLSTSQRWTFVFACLRIRSINKGM